MRNIVAIETFLTISESKVDYVTTQRRYVATQKFDAQVNLCRDIQKYCRDNVFLSINIGYFQLCCDIDKLCHDRLSYNFQRLNQSLSRHKETMLGPSLAIMLRQRESMLRH